MGRKKKEKMRAELYEEHSGVDADFDINISSAELQKISEEITFSDLQDRFDFQLKFEEMKREYTKLKYNEEVMEVIPLGKMQKSGKYILKKKNGGTFLANISNLIQL